MKEGREVENLSVAPFKTIKKSSRSGKDDPSSSEISTGNQIELFGEWQTIPMTRPELINVNLFILSKFLI